MEIHINYLPFSRLEHDIRSTRQDLEDTDAFTYIIDKEPKSPVEFFDRPVDAFGDIWET